ncbi:TPA: hypothetical protein QCQ09_002593 [Bacillus cereus]|nr:hypothetical protein [Bacillus cereus]
MKVNKTPINVYITGAGIYIYIRNNYIETNINIGNIHVMVFYGTSSNAQNALNHFVIGNKEVANLKLGLSEEISMNGNIESLEVINTKVHINNIGIVLIGQEGVSSIAALDPA